MYLENIQVSIEENKDKLTLKELIELYGNDYVPPYFVQNAGGRIYPFSYFWKEMLIRLDKTTGEYIQEQKERSKGVSQGCSRTWLNRERQEDKRLIEQIFKDKQV